MNHRIAFAELLYLVALLSLIALLPSTSSDLVALAWAGVWLAGAALIGAAFRTWPRLRARFT